MTAPKRAADSNLPEHWKVRICVRNCAVIHAISSTEPTIDRDYGGQISAIHMTPIVNTEHGDTVGFLDTKEVAAVTWRFAPLEAAEAKPPSKPSLSKPTYHPPCPF
jgi:hypothetical protein